MSKHAKKTALKFTAKDFGADVGPLVNVFDAARIANARLAEMLKDAPEVFTDNKGAKAEVWCTDEHGSWRRQTHRARLVNIEKIGGDDANGG